MNNPNLMQALTREGVLIKASVRYWRGCKKLRPEDLGLAPDQVSNRLIRLGHKRLLPREALAPLALVESRVHAEVAANTFPFLNGLAHFLPNAKLPEVTGRLRALEREFDTARFQFLDHYEEHRETALEEWRQSADQLTVDPSHLLATIEASFPPASLLERKYGFDVQLFQIAVPERLGLDLVSLGDQEQLIAARQQAADEASAQIRRQTQSFVADCIASLREQTAQLCEEMLHSIKHSENGVHQKTLNRLVRFIDQFKSMNFAGDQAMEQQLEAARQQLLTLRARDYRLDDTDAVRSLEEGLGKLADTARELARQDTTELVQRFGQLGRRKFHLAA